MVLWWGSCVAQGMGFGPVLGPGVGVEIRVFVACNLIGRFTGRWGMHGVLLCNFCVPSTVCRGDENECWSRLRALLFYVKAC